MNGSLKIRLYNIHVEVEIVLLHRGSTSLVFALI